MFILASPSTGVNLVLIFLNINEHTLPHMDRLDGKRKARNCTKYYYEYVKIMFKACKHCRNIETDGSQEGYFRVNMFPSW